MFLSLCLVISASANANASTSTSAITVPLRTPDQKRVTLAQALPGPYRLIIITKPWSDANEELFGTISKYRRRLNRGGLSAGVIFIGNDLWAARRITEKCKLKVHWFLDPKGQCCACAGLKVVPTVQLWGPGGKLLYSTPFLTEALIKQVAGHYKEDNPVKAPKPTSSLAPGSPPINPEGRYELR